MAWWDQWVKKATSNYNASGLAQRYAAAQPKQAAPQSQYQRYQNRGSTTPQYQNTVSQWRNGATNAYKAVSQWATRNNPQNVSPAPRNQAQYKTSDLYNYAWRNNPNKVSPSPMNQSQLKPVTSLFPNKAATLAQAKPRLPQYSVPIQYRGPMNDGVRGTDIRGLYATSLGNQAYTNRLSGTAAEYYAKPLTQLPSQNYASDAYSQYDNSGGYGGYGGWGGGGWGDGGWGGGGGGGGGYTDASNWYANMVQWQIGK